MKKTYEDIVTFDRAAGAYLKAQGGKENKLTYAIRRTAKAYVKPVRKAQEALQERLVDIDIDHASVDEQGNLIVKDKSYVFTKDAERERTRERREALRELNATGIDFEPHYCAQVPDDLSEEYREAFAGFCIREGAEAAAA